MIPSKYIGQDMSGKESATVSSSYSIADIQSMDVVNHEVNSRVVSNKENQCATLTLMCTYKTNVVLFILLASIKLALVK